MRTLTTLEAAESFVEQQSNLGKDIRWDGWDIVSFVPNERAVFSPTGAFRNNRWGYENRSIVSGEGVWHIDERNVYRPRSTRH